MKQTHPCDMGAIAAQLGLSIPAEFRGVDAVWPLLERMRAEGAVVIIKLDGERLGPDSRPYTVLVSGGPLAGSFVRTDAASVEEGLCEVIGRYAERVWGISR